ncbi:MAG: hypothetical protein HZB21_02690 [Deltaproteobacteria bacterium]|nr:hypothetical protein [Deltaproteobacteria bacterium]
MDKKRHIYRKGGNVKIGGYVKDVLNQPTSKGRRHEENSVGIWCVCLFTTGCATLVRGSNDKLLVNSLDQDSVIFVDGAPRGRGSVSVDVKRGQAHDLVAKKDGCQDVAIKTTESFDEVTLLGIFWYVIPVTIDLISGNAWKQDPTTYTITPVCPMKAPTPAIITQ